MAGISNNDSSSQNGSNSCSFLNGDMTKCEILVITKRVSVALSVIGSIFILTVIVLFRKYREPSQRLIAHLSFASLLFCVSCIMHDDKMDAKWLCQFQGALMSFAAWVILLWELCILFNLYFQFLFEFDIRKYEVQMTVFCWLVPAILMVLPFIEDAYVQTGVWCWVKNEFKWRFGFYYIWRILGTVIVIIIMTHITWKLRQEAKGERHSSTMSKANFESDIKTLSLYPIFYFFLTLFPIANRLYDLINDDGHFCFVLLLLHTFTSPMIGGSIAVVYVFDSRTRQSLTVKNIRRAIRNWRPKASHVQEYSVSKSMDRTDTNSSQPDC